MPLAKRHEAGELRVLFRDRQLTTSVTVAVCVSILLPATPVMVRT
jgi:hypothetical protein